MSTIRGSVLPSASVTLEELRQQFWWLGPSQKPRDSYLVALEGEKYEEALARDFHALGMTVKWKPFFSEKLRGDIEKAREKSGANFDEGRFLEEQRAAELRRETRAG